MMSSFCHPVAWHSAWQKFAAMWFYHGEIDWFLFAYRTKRSLSKRISGYDSRPHSRRTHGRQKSDREKK